MNRLEGDLTLGASLLRNDWSGLMARCRTMSCVLVMAVVVCSGTSAQQIGVEAGHSGRTIGATGATCPDGLTEVSVTESVSQKVAEILRQGGYEADVLSAILLNTSTGQQDDSGVWVHKGYSASVFIALHAYVCNTSHSGYKVSRWRGYNSDGTNGSSDASDRLVSDIWREYGLVTGQRRDDASITDNMRLYYGLNPGRGITSSTAGAILEMAYLSEKDLTATDEGRLKMAEGIVNALTSFLGTVSAVESLRGDPSVGRLGTTLQLSVANFTSLGRVPRLFVKRPSSPEWSSTTGTLDGNGYARWTVMTGCNPGDIGEWSAIAEAPWLLGDLNGDAIVNSLDFSILNGKWFTNDPRADINRDGLVNSLDFSTMNSNWFKTAKSGGRMRVMTMTFDVTPNPAGC